MEYLAHPIVGLTVAVDVVETSRYNAPQPTSPATVGLNC